MEINYSSTSYQGLNRHLSKQVFEPKNVEKLDKLFPKSNGIVGNIPQEWLKNIPVEMRGEIIPQLYQALGDFMRNIFPKLPGGTLKGIFLTRVLRKYNIINKETSIKVKKIGSGFMANGYKLKSSDGSTLFLKRFRGKTWLNRSLIDSGKHGKVREANLKTFLSHNLKKNSEKHQFTKFHYGDIHNGYYIEEYLSEPNILRPWLLDKDGAKNEIQLTLAKYKLYHCDLHNDNAKFYFDKNNKLQATCFDLGGIISLSLKNKKPS